ncbi:zinc ribbon domain-containing protein [Vulcanisaeta sp. EB80]|uniref:zinc ribbon domain-containing protein n=1 Tax=Vulcanisaeta sp. EB80 TaxID=1650660 RepID=UPI00118097F6|nr:zinc ribbon domain-containing protein [Vulcanisaeta sp. EB80]
MPPQTTTNETRKPLRRSIAVELETTKELNKLLHSIETAYLNIVRDVAEYAVVNNVTSATQLQGLFYSKYRGEYQGLHSHLVIQAIKQASEIAKSFIARRRKGLASKPYPEVKAVSIRFTEFTWGYEQFVKSIAPVRLELSLLGGRREVWLRLHKRFWLYWWRVLTGEAELASTLLIKRRLNRWYAVFIFKLKPRQEVPQSVVAFDINENTVAVGRIDIKTTVGKVVDWNRRYATPQLYEIRTDFGRLARRYEKIRNAIIERLKPHFTLPNGKYVNVTNTREYRKRVKMLREGRRKDGRIKHVANELTKTPAIIVTEELGEEPQDEMINGVGKGELRHRIKQIPFKAVERAVGDKTLERGSRIFHVSSYRNSRVCPVHFVRLRETNDWHILYCPLGHYVNRDYASVLNMMWKVTPEGWVKGVWWNMKSLSRNMNWRKHKGKSNPIIPHPIVNYIHAVLKTFTARLERCPAMLAQGDPMTRHRMQNEGGGEETSQKREEASPSQIEQMVTEGRVGIFAR